MFRVVANDFKKRPSEVNRKIKGLIEEVGCVQNCTLKNMFIESTYKSDRGRTYKELIKTENSVMTLFIESEYQHPQNKQWYKEYLLTRDGFSLLVMGFTGKEAFC